MAVVCENALRLLDATSQRQLLGEYQRNELVVLVKLRGVERCKQLIGFIGMVALRESFVGASGGSSSGWIWRSERWRAALVLIACTKMGGRPTAAYVGAGG